jgi:hypothetical protein
VRVTDRERGGHMSAEGQPYCQMNATHVDLEVLAYHPGRGRVRVVTSPHQGVAGRVDQVQASVTYRCRECGHRDRVGVGPESVWQPPPGTPRG